MHAIMMIMIMGKPERTPWGEILRKQEVEQQKDLVGSLVERRDKLVEDSFEYNRTAGTMALLNEQISGKEPPPFGTTIMKSE